MKTELGMLSAKQLYALANEKQQEEESLQEAKENAWLNTLEKKLLKKIPKRTLLSLRKQRDALYEVIDDFQVTATTTIKVTFSVYGVDDGLDYGFDYDSVFLDDQLITAGNKAVKNSKEYKRKLALKENYSARMADCCSKYGVKAKDLKEYVEAGA